MSCNCYDGYAIVTITLQMYGKYLDRQKNRVKILLKM